MGQHATTLWNMAPMPMPMRIAFDHDRGDRGDGGDESCHACSLAPDRPLPPPPSAAASAATPSRAPPKDAAPSPTSSATTSTPIMRFAFLPMTPSTAPSGPHSSFASRAHEAVAPTSSTANNASNASDAATTPSSTPCAPCAPCYAYSHSPCPLNRAELGRASWAYLHTLAAYYPASPTAEQQREMYTLMTLVAKTYPCGYCADRTKEELQRNPPRVSSQRELSRWLCEVHNEVNERMNKPIFDCARVDERWRTGPPDGSCR